MRSGGSVREATPILPHRAAIFRLAVVAHRGHASGQVAGLRNAAKESVHQASGLWDLSARRDPTTAAIVPWAEARWKTH